MAESKTVASAGSVADFLAAVAPEERQADALALDRLFQRVTGFRPALWGPSIVGYGRYRYRYDSGREGEMCAAGFSPRRSELVLYILPESGAAAPLLARLGRHRTGKSCLYLKRLADADETILEELIRAGLADLASRWPIRPD